MLKSKEYTFKQIESLIEGFKSIDKDIEHYLKELAIKDSIEKKTLTYFILDKKETYIKFYFTIASRPISLIIMSKEKRKVFIEDSRTPVINSILIAQLSKDSDKDKARDIRPNIYWDYIHYAINEELHFRYPIVYLECKPG